MNLLFGAILRFEEDASITKLTDKILDHIEEADFEEDDWDWLVWTSSVTMYMVFNAPLKMRASLLGLEGVRVAPLGVVSERMSDNRNQWVIPKSGDRPAYDVARERLLQWQSGLFADEATVTARPVEVEVDEDVVISMRSRRDRIKRAMHPEAPSKDVLDEFLNVGDAVDSDGKKFTFVQL